jgi:amino-acid N-acetyltransferase
MLDAETPRCRDAEEKQSKHDRFALSMNIHAATTADVPDILTLLRASALPTAGIERYVETALVVRDSERLLGCAAVEVYGQAGLLRSVAVDPERRGEGLGERLTKAALELARKRGVRNIYLLTTTASHFFPRFGFTAIPRAELDPALEQSEELRGACPASALAMRASLST